jgi:hypothetical protein
MSTATRASRASQSRLGAGAAVSTMPRTRAIRHAFDCCVRAGSGRIAPTDRPHVSPSLIAAPLLNAAEEPVPRYLVAEDAEGHGSVRAGRD